MTTHIFYNPKSGAASRRKKQCIQEQFANATFHTLPCTPTVQSDDVLIACGGDGTVSSVANIAIQNNCKLGIIPLGTGNLLAKQFRIPLTVKKACTKIHQTATTTKVDGLLIQGTYYFVNVGLGKVAKIVRDVANQKKRRWGMLTYIISALKYVFSLKQTDFSITIDGITHHTRGEELVILNTGHLGIHNISLDANPTDGVTELLILQRRTHFDLMPLATHFFLGRKCNAELVQRFKVKQSVHIQSSTPLPVQADGDLIDATPLTVQLKKKCLTIII